MNHDQTLKFKTNINCGGCVEKVTPFLNQVNGVDRWEVDTLTKDKILTVQAASSLKEAEVVEKVKEAGFRIELLPS